MYDKTKRVTKSQLISLLGRNDNNNDEEVSEEEGDGSVNEAGEIDQAESESDEPDPSDTPEIVALKLQLKITVAQQRAEERKWEIEKQRHALKVNSSSDSAGQHANSAGDSAESAVIRQLRGILPTLNEGTDIQSFFTSLEKCFHLHEIDERLWHKILPGCLCSNQKAQRAYSKIDLDHSYDYEYCKRQILASFKLNTTTYYNQFQSAERKGAENYKNFNTRLHELFSFYTRSRSIEALEDLIDDVVMNRFLESIPLATRNFVLARTPKTSYECAELADLWFEIDSQARREASEVQFGKASGSQQFGSATKGRVEKSLYGQRGPWNAPRTPQTGAGRGRGYYTNNSGNHGRGQADSEFKRETCYVCGSFTHSTREHNYGKGGNFRNYQGQVNRAAFTKKKLIDDGSLPRDYIMTVYVDGCETVGMRDTGSQYTLVNRELLPYDSVPTGTEVQLTGLFSGSVTVKFYEVSLRSDQWGYDGTIKATVGVVPNLCIGVIVGNNLYKQFPQLKDFLRIPSGLDTQSATMSNEVSKESCTAQVITRSRSTVEHCTSKSNTCVADEPGRDDQTTAKDGTSTNDRNATNADRMETINTDADSTSSRKQSEAEGHVSKQRYNGKQRAEVNTGDDSESVQQTLTSTEQTADEAREVDQVTRGTITWNDATSINQKTNDEDVDYNTECRRLSRMTDNLLSATARQHDRDTQRKRFASEQRADLSLKYWFSLAEQGNTNYVIDDDGLLFKRTPSWTGRDELLLVIPAMRREDVIKLSHDSSHFGRAKMIDKIQNEGKMTFPKIRRLCANYKSVCAECQLHSPLHKADRVPLKPIERIPEPFSHVSFDTMGSSLRKTKGGHQYVLVHTDMFSKYTDIVPLKNLRTEQTVNALLSIWHRVGFPTKVYIDQSTAHSSKLFTALREKLGINTAYSAVGLHHSSGQAERSISTVKTMIMKFLQKVQNSWDKLIPVLQSAINNTRSESTGMAPNELIFGRRIRGPMEILREVWIGDDIESDKQCKSVTEYLNSLRETLQVATNIAMENINKHQTQMKQIYDRQSTDRKFYPGQKVLLLLPTSSTKIEASWSGPYTVLKGDGFNYQIQMEGGRRQTYHINMLKQFNEKETTAAIVVTADSDGEIDELPITAETEATDCDDFIIGQQLTEAERSKLITLLSEFKDSVFSGKSGHTDLIVYDIKLTEDKVCYTPSYKIPDSLLDAVEDQLTKLLVAGLIEESDSANNSPLIVIQKPYNRGIRLVNNFVKLNEITRPEGYIMPDPADIIAKAAGANYVSALDLKDFYWQIPISVNSRPLTSFRTPFGTFQWTVLAQGLRGGPACAQKVVDKLLRGAGKYCRSIQDDLVIHTRGSLDTHLTQLRDVLNRLKQAGLTANVRKCRFLLENFELFGHQLCTRTGEITVSDTKTEVIKNLTRPLAKKKLMGFLGLCNYYSDLIKGYADIAFPLTELLKKKIPLNIAPLWGQQHESAFMALKEALISKPVLRAPDNSKPFILQTDASKVALGAAISQLDDNNKPYAIAYASRKLLPRETHYSTIELEALAIIFACQKFEQILYGRKIILETDHKPLQFIHSMSNKNGRLARWALIMQKWDLQPKYTPCGKMKHVDGLSRIYDE